MDPNTEKQRNEWMNHEGRDLYTEWMKDVLDIARTMQLQFSLDRAIHTSKRAYEQNGEFIFFADALLRILSEADYSMFDAGSHCLVDNLDAVAYYTSVGDFWAGSDKDNLLHHNKDGLEFAIKATLGLSLAVEKQLQQTGQIPTPERRYANFATRLRNPTFHATLEDFSLTGFAVHGNEIPNIMIVDNRSRFKEHYGIDHVHVVDVTINESSDEVISLSQEFEDILITKLKTQNKEELVDRIKQSEPWKPPISSGCPVRRPVPGEDKSAIALLSDFLADCVDEHMVSEESVHNVGRTALQS